MGSAARPAGALPCRRAYRAVCSEYHRIFRLQVAFCPGIYSFCRRRGSTGSTGSASCRCSFATSICSSSRSASSRSGVRCSALRFSSRRSVRSWRLCFRRRHFPAIRSGCRGCFGYYITHMLIIICGLSLTTLGFYRPRLKDLPGVAGTFLTTAFAALLVDICCCGTPFARRQIISSRSVRDVDISILNLFWKWIPCRFCMSFRRLPFSLPIWGWSVWCFQRWISTVHGGGCCG